MCKIIGALLFGLAIACAPGVQSEAAPSYKIVEIGASSKVAVNAGGLSDRDEAIAIVGNAVGDYPVGMRSFLYQGGKLVDLNLKPYPEQMAMKVTNEHLILGFEQSREQPMTQGFYLDARKQLHHLPMPGVFVPGDINSNGEIIGQFHKIERKNDSAGYWDAVGKFREIIVPYDGLEIVGWVNGSEFLATGGDLKIPQSWMLFIDAKSGEIRRRISHKELWSVQAVNSDGVFVGYINADSGGEIPFKYVNDHVVKLPLGAGTEAEAKAINEAGAIVGTTYYHTETVKTATLWLDGKSYDLNRLCSNLAGWKLEEAGEINARGTILCVGKHKGRVSACLLFPVGAAKK